MEVRGREDGILWLRQRWGELCRGAKTKRTPKENFVREGRIDFIEKRNSLSKVQREKRKKKKLRQRRKQAALKKKNQYYLLSLFPPPRTPLDLHTSALSICLCW